MKVALFGEQVSEIESTVREAGFDVVSENPEVVLSYGGDGTFLRSEHAYPGIPKILIKNSPTCRLCTDLPIDEVLQQIKIADYSTYEIKKLRVETNGNKWYALNDVVVHNKDPRFAIRFDLETPSGTEQGVIGDGIIIATTFGSTGYYQSVTHSTFSSGIGVAFNNSSKARKPLLFSEDNFSATLTIERGPGVVYVDNLEDEVVLESGDSVRIFCSSETAQVLIVDDYPKPMSN